MAKMKTKRRDESDDWRGSHDRGQDPENRFHTGADSLSIRDPTCSSTAVAVAAEMRLSMSKTTGVRLVRHCSCKTTRASADPRGGPAAEEIASEIGGPVQV